MPHPPTNGRWLEREVVAAGGEPLINQELGHLLEHRRGNWKSVENVNLLSDVERGYSQLIVFAKQHLSSNTGVLLEGCVRFWIAFLEGIKCESTLPSPLPPRLDNHLTHIVEVDCASSDELARGGKMARILGAVGLAFNDTDASKHKYKHAVWAMAYASNLGNNGKQVVSMVRAGFRVAAFLEGYRIDLVISLQKTVAMNKPKLPDTSQRGEGQWTPAAVDDETHGFLGVTRLCQGQSTCKLSRGGNANDYGSICRALARGIFAYLSLSTTPSEIVQYVREKAGGLSVQHLYDRFQASGFVLQENRLEYRNVAETDFSK